MFYHIYNRGINGEDLFKEERNYSYFKTLLTRHLLSCTDILTCCLMKNHFHLCIQVKNTKVFQPENKVSKNFSNFFNAYTKTINKHYKRTGSLFETPFKRKKLNSDFYVTQLIYYIHANPQKHGFIDDFRNYTHSSYNDVLNDIHSVVNNSKVIEWFSQKEFFIKYHMSYKKEIMKLSSFD